VGKSTRYNPQRWLCTPCDFSWLTTDDSNTCEFCGQPGDPTGSLMPDSNHRYSPIDQNENRDIFL
jgi:hypothetical protein